MNPRATLLSRIRRIAMSEAGRRGVAVLATLAILAAGIFALGNDGDRGGPTVTSQGGPDLTPSGLGEAQPSAGPSPSETVGRTSKSRSRSQASGGAQIQQTLAPGEPIKIGVTVNIGNPGKAVGLDLGSDDQQPIPKAMVKEINATGGIAGHQIELVIETVDQTDEGQGTQTRLQNEACTALTEDEHVFLAISGGTYDSVACYARHETPFLGGEFMDDQYFNELSPWALPTFNMSMTKMGHLLPVALADQGYMTKNMGILSWEHPITRRVVKNQLIPGIEARGGKIVDQIYAAPEYADLAAQTSSAVLKWHAQNIDRVVIGAWAAGLWLLFARQADAQEYFPRYGISSFNFPFRVGEASIPQRQLKGSTGFGYTIGFDLNPAVQPTPTDREKACWGVINKWAGTKYSSRDTNGTLALYWCETFYGIRAALAPATGKVLRQSEVLSYFTALGSSYQPVAFPRARFEKGNRDGNLDYARLAYDDSCPCFKYRSGWLEIP